MREKIGIHGQVTVRVLDRNGNVKRKKPGFFRSLLGLPGREIMSKHHNIVVREGDALIADALLAAPSKAKVTSASGFIQVGTGWTGNSTKSNTRCNTPTGQMKALDENYPLLNAAWGNNGDNAVTYRATFSAGSLDANGINEAALLNGNTSNAQCLAYAQITPTTNVTTGDTLQVIWEITITGQ
jgi:hypothetical protein